MATGIFSVAHPTSGSAGEVKLGEVLSPQAWADIMHSLNVVGKTIVGGTGAVTFEAVQIDGTGGNNVTTPAGTILVGGSTASDAITGTGGANMTGGVFYGGSGNADGVRGFGAGTGDGLVGAGGNTGDGVFGQGGATSGHGGVFTALGGNSDGVRGTATGTGSAIHALTGPMQVDTTRSSATGGAGQSVAAGAIYKDTTCFAWGKVTVNPGAPSITLVRGANVASVARPAVGQYTVTLQTAATNHLCIIVTPLISAGGAICMTVDSPDGTAPTTTTFKVLCFDAAGAAADVPGAGNEGFFFVCYQG